MKTFKFIFILIFLFVLLALSFRNYIFIPNVLYSNKNIKEAMYYRKLPNSRVQCLLCPRLCQLKDGQKGFCNSRINRKGRLYSLTYGKTIAITFPLFLRTSLIYCSTNKDMLRLATVGCNMKCKFCFTWQISQSTPEEIESMPYSRKIDAVTTATPILGLLEPKDIIAIAKKAKCEIITYNIANEPTTNYEYVLETAKLAKYNGLINILVTNGYINEAPLKELLQYMNGVSVGLKGFTEEVYIKYCSAHLEPIQKSLKIIRDAGIGLEITYPVIPTVNDDAKQIKEMCLWIKENLGTDIPIQFIRYLPAYRLAFIPPTPITTLESAEKIAHEAGLKNVSFNYLGGYPGVNFEEKIYCPHCNKLILYRKGGKYLLINNTKDGKCKFCGYRLSVIVLDDKNK